MASSDLLQVFGMLYARELPQVTIPENFLPIDYSQARYFIEKAAFLGFAKAQVRIAAAFELCQLGCEFDPVLSLHYNELAARQGEPEAEMAISKWFLSGCEGIFEKNESMAFTYAQRAANSGLPTAEFAVGYYYEVGINVPVSIDKAKVWYKKAADNGNKDAQGRIEGISRSKTLSRKDHEKIAMDRIKSTRGTRGKRPERFANRESGPTAMPDATTPSGSASFSGQPGEGPISMPAGPDYQPPYAAPYGRNSPSNAYRNPYGAPPQQQAAPYPNSNLNPYPNQRQPQPPRSPVGRGGPGYYGSGPMNQPPQQQPPYRGTSPAPPPGGSAYPPGYRVSSSNYPGGPPSGPGTPVSQPPQAPPKPKPVGVDIGYTAPPDFGRPHPPRSESARPQPGTPGGSSVVLAPSQRPGPQHANTFQGPAPSPGPAGGVAGRPPPKGQGVAPTPPPANTGPSARPGQVRHGKGPATFEEMGVPQKKKEDDCVSASVFALCTWSANVTVVGYNVISMFWTAGSWKMGRHCIALGLRCP